MSRLLATMKMDITAQVRNNLYSIGIGAGIVVAIALSQLTLAEQLPMAIPTLMLLVVGGSTMLYVSGMIIFEKQEGTLNAVIVSPLRPAEYLWSKIITLTLLASIESIVMVGGTMLIMSFSQEVIAPNIPLILIGIITIGMIYTLVGIVMIVRYDKITEFLIPMSAVAVILQVPFVHFLGIFEHPTFLIIPTSAPTMLMRGAYLPLTTPEWIYAIAYTGVLIVGLSIWAYRAFETHIIMKVG